MFTAFPRGLFAHARGIRFALAHKGYLTLVAVPFALTLLLYVVGFALFATHGDQLLGLLWTPNDAAGGLAGALAWLYLHVVKYLLYLLAFVILYFLFMVTANILASPLYDVIAGRLLGEAGAAVAAGPSPWRTMAEELKKAVFVAALPLLVVFIPVLGQFLAPVLAAWLLAFDFLDFAHAREEPRFAARLRAMAGRPLLLLGFGLPLLVPLLNIVLFPFAILGATLLYLEATGRARPGSGRK
jgi:CysZ protein